MEWAQQHRLLLNPQHFVHAKRLSWDKPGTLHESLTGLRDLPIVVPLRRLGLVPRPIRCAGSCTGEQLLRCEKISVLAHLCRVRCGDLGGETILGGGALCVRTHQSTSHIETSPDFERLISCKLALAVTLPGVHLFTRYFDGCVEAYCGQKAVCCKSPAPAPASASILSG